MSPLFTNSGKQEGKLKFYKLGSHLPLSFLKIEKYSRDFSSKLVQMLAKTKLLEEEISSVPFQQSRV